MPMSNDELSRVADHIIGQHGNCSWRYDLLRLIAEVRELREEREIWHRTDADDKMVLSDLRAQLDEAVKVISRMVKAGCLHSWCDKCESVRQWELNARLLPTGKRL